jgi:predicted nucleotidyltransferase
MKREDVIAALKETEPRLWGFGVAALYLFGSYARGEAGPDSDVDVFIDKDESRPFGFDEFMDTYLLLQNRLGDNVDYGTREGLHPLLRAGIEQEAVRVF